MKRNLLLVLFCIFCSLYTLCVASDISQNEMSEAIQYLENPDMSEHIREYLMNFGDKYHIPELNTYAVTLQKNYIDTCNRKAIACADRMIALSDSTFGKISYESAYLRVLRSMWLLDRDLNMKQVQELQAISEELYRTSPCPKNKEMYYLCRFWALTNERIYDPSQEITINNLLLEINSFYSNYPRTRIKYKLYKDAAQHIQTLSNIYPVYTSCLAADLMSRGLKTDIFDMTDDTLYVNNFPIIMKTKFFSKESMQCYRELYAESPLNIKMEELNYISDNQISQDDADALWPYLQNNYSEISSHFGNHHPSTIYSHLLLNTIAKHLGKKVTFSKEETKTFASQLIPDGSIFYVGYLRSALLLSDDISEKQFLADEAHRFADIYLADDTISRLLMRAGDLLLQRQDISGYEDSYPNIKTEFKRLSKSHPSWDLVSFGKTLMILAGELFNQYEDAIEINYIVLKMVQELASDTSLIFLSEYANYLTNAVNLYSHTIPIPNLDGSWGIEHLVEDISLKKTNNSCLKEAIQIALARYYLFKKEKGNAKLLHKQIIENIQSCQKNYNNADYHRYTELEAYAELLFIMLSDDTPEQEILSILHTLEALYYSSPQYLHIASIKVLFDYYVKRKEWGKANQVVDFALQQYDAKSPNLQNSAYVKITSLKIELLKKQEASIDQCRQITERIERDLKHIKDFSNLGTYIELLQLMCDLTGSTQSDDILHYRNLRLLLDNAIKCYELSGKSDYIFQTYLLPAFTTICIAIYSKDPSNQPLEYYLLQSDIVHIILPELLSREKQFHESHNNDIMLDLNLAIAYDIAGNPNKAEEYFNKHKSDTPSYIDMLLIVHNYLYVNDEDNALLSLQNAAEIYSINEGNNNLAICMMKWINAFSQRHFEEAEQYAWRYYAAAQAYLKENLPFFTQAETEQFLKDHGVGGMPIQVMVVNPNSSQAAEFIRQSYNVNLQLKGLMLRKEQQLYQAIVMSGDSTLKDMYETILSLRKELLQFDKSQISITKDKEIIEKYQQLDNLERTIVRAVSLMPESKEEPVTWLDVRDNLQDGEVAIEYVVNNYAVYALIVSPDCSSPEPVLLGTADQFSFIQNILSDTDLTEIQKVNRLYSEKNELYDLVWKPLEAHLKGVKTIYFSPTGLLNLISFQALRVDANTCLIDKYDLHQLTTTALLAERNKPSRSFSQHRHAKIYGGIYYNDLQELNDTQLAHMRQEYQTQKENKNPVLLAKRNIQADAFPFLPNTLHEADGIHHVLESIGVSSSEEIGYAPSEKSIRGISGNSPEILHISTHGFFFSDPSQVHEIPYFQKGGALNAMTCSGLALSHAEDAWLGQTDADSKEDNILTSSEVSELDLRNTQLVVLSACQTGLGNAGADGMFGLQRGFKQAGVQSICASLWSVADRATSEMMQLFYQYWMSGKMTMHQAMKRAMQEQRASTPSPYYWAPFVLLDAIE